MTLNDYAKKILIDAGCDEYSYGGEWSKHIMDDLKTAFPNGMEFPYIDVANAILAISRPEPIKKAKYHMVFDMPDTIDCDSFDSLEKAKSALWDTYLLWMSEEWNTWKSAIPTEEEKDNWDDMIYNFGCWIEEYDPMTDDYGVCFEPTSEELEEIGWKLFNEE